MIVKLPLLQEQLVAIVQHFEFRPQTTKSIPNTNTNQITADSWSTGGWIGEHHRLNQNPRHETVHYTWMAWVDRNPVKLHIIPERCRHEWTRPSYRSFNLSTLTSDGNICQQLLKTCHTSHIDIEIVQPSPSNDHTTHWMWFVDHPLQDISAGRSHVLLRAAHSRNCQCLK